MNKNIITAIALGFAACVVSIFLNASHTISPAPLTTPNSPLEKTEKKADCLVIGTRGTAYAMIKKLLQEKFKVTVLTYDKNKAEALFDGDENLLIVQGAIEKNAALAKQLALGKKYIFYMPYFPHEKMAANMQKATHNILKAVNNPETVIIFPSRSYSIGQTKTPATETVTTNPCSDIGRVFDTAEKTLLAAAQSGICKSIIIRHSHPFGPNVIDGLMDKIFINFRDNEPIQWINSSKIGYQICYTYDIANIIISLLERTTLNNSMIIHYAGRFINPIENWLEEIAEKADAPLRIDEISSLKINTLALFRTDARACKDVFYSFSAQTPLLLDDSKLKALLPDFVPTPMKEAIEKTFAWFNK